MSGVQHDVVRLVAHDGVPLALHRWVGARPRAVLQYVHGIQSHAGWLFETGPALARRGVSVYALDRRGSGRSGGPRGHLPSAADVTADYTAAFAAVARDTRDLPLTLLGQSFGASILAAILAGGGVNAHAAVLCAPAIGQQRARHGPDALDRLRRLAGLYRSPLGLRDEQYTGEPRYLDRLANDHLMLRQVTDATRATLVALEDSYMTTAARTGTTVHFVRPAEDSIIDLDAARAATARLADTVYDHPVPARAHYLEFTADRFAYWDLLTAIVLDPPC